MKIIFSSDIESYTKYYLLIYSWVLNCGLKIHASGVFSFCKYYIYSLGKILIRARNETLTSQTKDEKRKRGKNYCLNVLESAV